MADKTDIVPVTQAARAAVFAKMNPRLQAVAAKFENELGRGAKAGVMAHFNLGKALLDIENDTTGNVYGRDAQGALAAYLPIGRTAGYLTNVRRFAAAFTGQHDFVAAESAKPFDNGGYLTLQHWLQLAKIEDGKEVAAVLQVVREKCLTAAELADQVAASGALRDKRAKAGGRRTKLPSNVVFGMAKVGRIANAVVRLDDVIEANVFGQLDELTADAVSDDLVKQAEAAAAQFRLTAQHAERYADRFDKAATKAQKLLAARQKAEAKAAKAEAKAKRDEAGDEADEEGPDEPPAAPKRVKAREAVVKAKKAERAAAQKAQRRADAAQPPKAAKAAPADDDFYYGDADDEPGTRTLVAGRKG